MTDDEAAAADGRPNRTFVFDVEDQADELVPADWRRLAPGVLLLLISLALVTWTLLSAAAYRGCGA